MGEEELVSFHKLFSFADSTDYALMLVGTVAAVANGLSLPLMTLIFGALVDSFGIYANTTQVLPKVSKVPPSLFLYIVIYDRVNVNVNVCTCRCAFSSYTWL